MRGYVLSVNCNPVHIHIYNRTILRPERRRPNERKKNKSKGMLIPRSPRQPAQPAASSSSAV